jgi:CubicO group peptidase (beta-lactamase class C family)
MIRQTFAIGAAALLITAASVPANDIQQPGPQFDINDFEQGIRSRLNRKAAGFAYAISQNGQLKKAGQGGQARTFMDAPALAQSANKRMNIASISKPITATLVHKLIQDKMVPGSPNLTLNSRISPFLPAGWVKGPGVNTLTFAELLSQYTGMNDNGGSTGTNDLRDWIAAGVTRPKTQYKYINANIAIFRILIPFMMLDANGRANINQLEQINPAGFSTFCGNFYKAAVRVHLFTPMGIQNADMENADPQPTLLYSTNPLEKGIKNGDWTEVGAGGGWYLSAVELARFFSYLRYDNNILKPATRKQMNDLSECPGPDCRMLGWQRPHYGEQGIYYYHSGSLTYGADDDLTKSGMRGVVMNFPNNTEVVLLVNSIGPYESVRDLVADAFDEAWQ